MQLIKSIIPSETNHLRSSNYAVNLLLKPTIQSAVITLLRKWLRQEIVELLKLMIMRDFPIKMKQEIDKKKSWQLEAIAKKYSKNIKNSNNLSF